MTVCSCDFANSELPDGVLVRPSWLAVTEVMPCGDDGPTVLNMKTDLVSFSFLSVVNFSSSCLYT